MTIDLDEVMAEYRMRLPEQPTGLEWDLWRDVQTLIAELKAARAVVDAANQALAESSAGYPDELLSPPTLKLRQTLAAFRKETHPKD
jgi:hypothetical protein